MEYRYDAVIVGAGVAGAAAARVLSRYAWRVAVLEKEEDVCCQTSKANSGIIHAGFDAEPGTQKARFNVEGSRMMEQLCRELEVPYRRCGALVVCTEEERMPELERLLEQGKKNGVARMELLRGREALERLEGRLAPEVRGALYAPDSAIVCPFELTLAMAEQAAANGVDFYFNTEVERIFRMKDGGYRLEANRKGENAEGSAKESGRAHAYKGIEEDTGAAAEGGKTAVFEAAYVVNAAGVYADVLHNMVSTKKLHITPRRGEYELLDKEAGGHVAHTVFSLPGRMGKGVLVTPTVHGNLLLGPTARDAEDREDTSTTREGLAEVREKAERSVSGIPMKKVITSFSGLRAHEKGGDFVVGEAPGAPGFIDCAGIESPGLTSAPAIAEEIGRLLEARAHPAHRQKYIKTRRGLHRTASMSEQEYAALVHAEPAYGKIVCRCEQVTEGEILEAIRRPLGARSLDGIKRRTRAGMGRCQGGFCSVAVMKLLSQELGRPLEEITKCGPGSELGWGRTRPWARENGGGGKTEASGQSDEKAEPEERRSEARTGREAGEKIEPEEPRSEARAGRGAGEKTEPEARRPEVRTGQRSERGRKNAEL